MLSPGPGCRLAVVRHAPTHPRTPGSNAPITPCARLFSSPFQNNKYRRRLGEHCFLVPRLETTTTTTTTTPTTTTTTTARTPVRTHARTHGSNAPKTPCARLFPSPFQNSSYLASLQWTQNPVGDFPGALFTLKQASLFFSRLVGGIWFVFECVFVYAWRQRKCFGARVNYYGGVWKFSNVWTS